jgi:hypothetical protein
MFMVDGWIFIASISRPLSVMARHDLSFSKDQHPDNLLFSSQRNIGSPSHINPIHLLPSPFLFPFPSPIRRPLLRGLPRSGSGCEGAHPARRTPRGVGERAGELASLDHPSL